MIGRLWVVMDGIEAEDGGPCTEWWLAPYVQHPDETDELGAPDWVLEEEIHGWQATPEWKGPYASERTAERWADHHNRKESARV